MDTEEIKKDPRADLEALGELSISEVRQLAHAIMLVKLGRDRPARKEPVPFCKPNEHVWKAGRRRAHGSSGAAKAYHSCIVCGKVVDVTTQPWRRYPDTDTGRIYGSPLGRLTVGEIMDAVRHP